jgi:hypothetical protein
VQAVNSPVHLLFLFHQSRALLQGGGGCIDPLLCLSSKVCSKSRRKGVFALSYFLFCPDPFITGLLHAAAGIVDSYDAAGGGRIAALVIFMSKSNLRIV